MGFKEEERLLKPLREVTLLLIVDDEGQDVVVKFNVTKAKLVDGLNFISEGRDTEQRQARSRKVFADLIATSHK